MRRNFLSILLPLWALALPLAVAQVQEEATPENTVSPTPDTEPRQQDKLAQLLDDMAKTQDDDFYAAACYVLEQSGDELAFHARMKELAEQEHPVAMYWLARSLRSEESPYQDEAVASRFRELVTKSAAKNYLPAMIQAAQALFFGGETDEERSEGKELLVRACKMGSAKARACYLVMTGLLTDRDSNLEAPEIATELKHHNFYVEEFVAEACWGDLEWLRVAAEHGSAWAAYELALRGHLHDKESLAYLRTAADRHLPEAMTTLGCLLCLGPLPASHHPQQISSLPEKAIPMSETPAEPDKIEADSAELDMQPTAESIAEGLLLLRRATAMGDERAAAFLALAAASGKAGDVPAQRIAELFRYSHERELPFGTTGWGYCLVCGRGCDQDVQHGINLLQQMSKQGVAWANLALSHLYKNGIGVGKNESKAAEYRKMFDKEKDFAPFIPTEPDDPFFPTLHKP